jgi:CubicO group peptidase (beta-lactamase class C family)
MRTEFFCLFAASTAAAQSSADSLAADRVIGAGGRALDSALRAMEARGLSGTVLVAKRGEILLLEGYGFADRAAKVKNSAATRFEMNSITKPFTAAAILRLAADGRLDLDGTLERYLGAFPPGKRSATIRHLATHTAGLVVANATLDGTSRDGFVASVKAAARESPPGDAYRYSNAGFSLLAAVVEAASQRPFETYVREELFARARLATAMFRDAVPDDDPRFAKGYAGDSAAPRLAPANPYVWGTRGAGGIWSTVGDMYRWVVALDGTSVVPTSVHGELFVPRPAPREGFGWHVESRDGRAVRQKGGGSAGYQSQILWFPNDGVVIIWATNDQTRAWRTTLNETLSSIALRAP